MSHLSHERMPSWYEMKFLVFRFAISVIIIVQKGLGRVSEFTESPVCEIFEWHFTIGQSCFRSCEKLNLNRSKWNSWSILHSVCAGKHVCVSVCLRLKWLSCLPGGTWGGLTGEKRERERESRLKEWRDYPHTVDWSLKRSCSVQLGSTSLRRTWHR